MAMIIDIADAVTMQLNAAPSGTFAPPITAVRCVLPEFDLSDLMQIKVSVVPKSRAISSTTRTTIEHEIAVDIGVQKKLGKDLDAEVAQLSTLMDQIAQYLCHRPLIAAPHVAWISIAHEPVYAPQHLAQQRVFTSVLTVTYRLLK